MVEAIRTPEISKRAKWEKIKKDLLKLPKRIPRVVAITIDTKNERINIVTEPVGFEYEQNIYDIAAQLCTKYKLDFPNVDIINLHNYTRGWKELIGKEDKAIYERPY